MTGLVLIASYPKSGNTWMRLLLETLRRGGNRPDINAVGIVNAASRVRHDQILDIETADLTPEEVAHARRWVWQRRRDKGQGDRVLKVHDAYLAPPGMDRPPFAPDIVDRVLYIVRDPRDVAISLAHHFGLSLEQAADRLADGNFKLGLSQDSLNPQLEQFGSSWSRHVESWLDASQLLVHCVCYEDVLRAPSERFGEVVRFLGLTMATDALQRTVDACAFEALSAEERMHGFRETMGGATAPFFRRGVAGGWRDTLPKALVRKIEGDHGPTMRRLGYETVS
jgi:aryl sulfotransferase